MDWQEQWENQWEEEKKRVLDLYYGTDFTSLEISVQLDIPREIVLDMILEDYEGR